ncbi:MAG TPA: hypothetical protein PLU73_07475 [Bacteroidia bacterium]|nr:hypothetical protein [Bacteroidia bacterium]
MNTLHNYACGQWVAGSGKSQELFNAITGEAIATASSGGLDFGMMCDYARKTGGPKLRKLTFQERGMMLKALALHLMSKKDIFGYPNPRWHIRNQRAWRY